MKKILGLLGAVMLTTTAAAPVVSCDNNSAQNDFSASNWNFTSLLSSEDLSSSTDINYNEKQHTINFQNGAFDYDGELTQSALSTGLMYSDYSALKSMQTQFIKNHNNINQLTNIKVICGLAGKNIDDMLTNMRKIKDQLTGDNMQFGTDFNFKLSMFVIKSFAPANTDIQVINNRFSLAADIQEINMTIHASQKGGSINVKLGPAHQENLKFQIV